MAKASARLSSGANSVVEGLQLQLGKESALVNSLNSVGQIVENGRSAASELKAISSMMEQRLTSTFSAMLQSGDVLKKAAETVPDLIKRSCEQGSAEMAAKLETVTNKLVEEKLGQLALGIERINNHSSF